MIRNICRALALDCRVQCFVRSYGATSACSSTIASTSPARLMHLSPGNRSKSGVSSFYDRYVFPEPPSMITDDEHDKVIQKVNEVIQDPGRLFAVVVTSGQQFKVTAGDLIRIDGLLPAECGTRIRLEKVCLVGGKDFTLLGKPVLPRKTVKVTATVIEKTPGEDVVIKRFIRRKRHEKTYKYNALHTILRINEIAVTDHIE